MKKKLTINTLAFGNLKNHKKAVYRYGYRYYSGYGFSSSVIISLFSFHYSRLEMGRKAMGIQDEILINISEQANEKCR